MENKIQDREKLIELLKQNVSIESICKDYDFCINPLFFVLGFHEHFDLKMKFIDILGVDHLDENGSNPLQYMVGSYFKQKDQKVKLVEVLSSQHNLKSINKFGFNALASSLVDCDDELSRILVEKVEFYHTNFANPLSIAWAKSQGEFIMKMILNNHALVDCPFHRTCYDLVESCFIRTDELLRSEFLSKIEKKYLDENLQDNHIEKFKKKVKSGI